MARQRAIGEPLYIGFVDDVHNTARCGQKAHPHQHHRGDNGDLGAGPHPQACPALHAPVHHGVGSLVETLLARADLGLHAEMAISWGQLPGRGRAHLQVGQREFLERC